MSSHFRQEVYSLFPALFLAPLWGAAPWVSSSEGQIPTSLITGPNPTSGFGNSGMWSWKCGFSMLG